MKKIKNHITKVQKRDGRVVEFVQEKIIDAIYKAITAAGQGDGIKSKKASVKVLEILNRRFKKDEIPTIEQIQDIVEKVLIKSGHSQTAKTYILYRQQRKKSRAMGATFLDVNKTIGEYLHQSHWNVNDNANEAYSFSGLLLHTA